MPRWTFGDRLRKIRTEYSLLNQDQIARALGVGGPRYEAWESGRNTPRPEIMVEVATKLEALTDVPAWWILGNPPPKPRKNGAT